MSVDREYRITFLVVGLNLEFMAFAAVSESKAMFIRRLQHPKSHPHLRIGCHMCAGRM
jgi:hypothetical protein